MKIYLISCLLFSQMESYSVMLHLYQVTPSYIKHYSPYFQGREKKKEDDVLSDLLSQGFACHPKLALSIRKTLVGFEKADESQRYSLGTDQLMLAFICFDGNRPGNIVLFNSE